MSYQNLNLVIILSRDAQSKRARYRWEIWLGDEADRPMEIGPWYSDREQCMTDGRAWVQKLAA